MTTSKFSKCDIICSSCLLQDTYIKTHNLVIYSMNFHRPPRLHHQHLIIYITTSSLFRCGVRSGFTPHLLRCFSRLFGDFAAEIGASRHDFSKPFGRPVERGMDGSKNETTDRRRFGDVSGDLRCAKQKQKGLEVGWSDVFIF